MWRTVSTGGQLWDRGPEKNMYGSEVCANNEDISVDMVNSGDCLWLWQQDQKRISCRANCLVHSRGGRTSVPQLGRTVMVMFFGLLTVKVSKTPRCPTRLFGRFLFAEGETFWSNYYWNLCFYKNSCMHWWSLTWSEFQILLHLRKATLWL